MIIVKCSCGSLFTFAESTINTKRWISCQGCGSKAYYNPEESINYTVAEMSKVFASVQKIPNDAKLTVTFDV